jgi:glutathione S-transferase
MKPIILHGSGPSPNPVKVAILLEELGLPFEVRQTKEIKSEPFISLNPNGRLPAIEDPNTGVKVFEVRIDYNHQLSVTTTDVPSHSLAQFLNI